MIRTGTLLCAAAALLAGCGTGAADDNDSAAWEAGETPSAGAISAPPEPSATPTPSKAPATSAAPSPSASKSPRTAARYVFPVSGSNVSYHPTHSGYPATDIFAACGQPVLAVTDGRILEVSRVDKFVEKTADGTLNGGKSVSLLGDDGVRYYGSHLSSVSGGINAGVRVRAGQRLGSVGKTGNANNVCHLHFGISPSCAKTDDWWIRRGVVWPAPFLDSWRKKAGKSPVAAVRAYSAKKGCPQEP